MIPDVAKEFNEADGEFIPTSAGKEQIKARFAVLNKRVKSPREFIHSQFFGKKRLLELLDKAGDDCAGLKFNFAQDGDTDLDISLVIEAVDKYGIVIGGNPLAKAAVVTYSLANGPRCPKTCIPPVPNPDEE